MGDLEEHIDIPTDEYRNWQPVPCFPNSPICSQRLRAKHVYTWSIWLLYTSAMSDSESCCSLLNLGKFSKISMSIQHASLSQEKKTLIPMHCRNDT